MMHRRALLKSFILQPSFYSLILELNGESDDKMNQEVYNRLKKYVDKTSNNIIDYESLDFGFSINGEEPIYLEYMNDMGGIIYVFTETHDSWGSYYSIHYTGELSEYD